MAKVVSQGISVAQLTKMDLTQLPPVCLVLGQEPVLLTQVQQYFEHLLPEAEAQMNFGRYDLTETNLAAALDDAASVPFFGDWRLVILTQPTFLTAAAPKNKLDQPVDLLSAYLKQPQPTTKLVIWADYEKLDERKKLTKLLKKTALTIDVSKLTGPAVSRTLTASAKQAQIKLAPDAQELLLHRVRDDYSQAYQQLEQLQLYAGPGQTITKAMVADLVAQIIDDNIFDLVAATLNHQLQSALQIYQKLLLNGAEPIALLALILTQVRLLLQTKIMQQAGFQQGSIAQQLKVHPYRVKLALQQNRHFELAQLMQMYQELVTLDYHIKTGRAEKEQALALVITKFASRS
ncbi:MAG: DNA polymerase III subunit delta [Lactobacillaceae bacterium]|nr:DNA polymerase III subunit delta [Lactobacillaceae bacterium]